jgi:hypothetical protein
MSATTPFNRMLGTLYVIALSFCILMLIAGGAYYMLPVTDRPHSDLHTYLKPSGSWGHGMGIVGSAMVLLLFLYSMRKGQHLGVRWGRLRSWLDVHIFFGIIGPLLITLHTAMKFGGIVSISYFSMVAVVLSGFFGRYIYMQIPRDHRGSVVSLDKMRQREAQIERRLSEEMKVPPTVTQRIALLSAKGVAPQSSGLKAILWSIHSDMVMPFRLYRLRRFMRKAKVPSGVVYEISALTRERLKLVRRITLLTSMRQVFHLWHILHKPFAYVMIIIMFIHIAVTVAFGYRWIF